MVDFPQSGRCLCKEIEYLLNEDPVTLYLCHCVDCQTQTGSSFAMSMLMRQEAFEIIRGTPEEICTPLDDGRVWRTNLCRRCGTRLWGPSSVSGLIVVEPGSLDDTSWLQPIGHIWARSAQPWIRFSESSIVFQEQPAGDEALALVRAWKTRTPEG